MEGFRLNYTAYPLAVGAKHKLAAKTFPTDTLGNGAMDMRLKYESSNERIVSVDSEGNMWAHSNGEAVITVTSCDVGRKASCKVIVKLSDDYLNFTDEYKRIEAAYWREAATMVYHEGYYYMIASGLTSWACI